MTRFIAFYLPQYHPIPENDKWYGKGFTEWTNVAKATKLYRKHYQPHIPADLGFYDLRVPEIRREQANMAIQYGIEGFCYWYYWFGNGKQLLEMPIWEMYKDKTIKLPFCIAWANHSWEKKMWDKNGNNKLLVEQNYLGIEDYSNFFYTVLPLFKDERYIKVNGKLLFVIYNPLESIEIKTFIKTWKKLAIKEGLDGFYFVGKDFDCRNKSAIINLGFDSIYDDNVLNIHHHLSIHKKISLYLKRKLLKRPTVFKYKEAMRYMLTNNSKKDDVIPVIAPNWDHSPRSGVNGFILDDCKPIYFGKLVRKSIEIVENKEKAKQIVFIKAWNEWGEGNHLEPDLKYGKGYLEEIRNAISK